MKLCIIIILLISLSSIELFGFEFNVNDRIKTRDYYKKNFDLIYGNPKYSNRDEFKRIYHTLTKRTRNKIQKFISVVHKHVPEQILMPLIYWRFLRHNKVKTANVLTYLFLDKILVLRDYAEDPRSLNRIQIHNILREVTRINDLRTDEIYSTVFPLLEVKSSLLANLKEDKVFIQALMETNLFTLDLAQKIGHKHSYVLDQYGFIPGNKVQFLSQKESKIALAKWFNKNIIHNGGVLNFNAPYIEMPYRNSYNGHILFKTDPILHSVKNLIDLSKESILIDMFLMGGTIGATLAEYILDKTKEKLVLNKNFKVLILHDYENHNEMEKEVMPVFTYLKNRINKDRELNKAIILLQANLQRHVKGVYPIPSTLLRNKKNDHSKVLVIDANSNSPEALIGSKNLTDHFGGYFLDTAAHIIGPAAALVQASYFYDIDAALTTIQEEKEAFTLKDHGFSNQQYLSRKKEILKKFKIKRINYPYIGSDRVRIAESDVDGKIKNTRNILIDMILKAKKSIYMDQRFLYDSHIVDSIIKKKISIPSLDIKIIIDNNRSNQFGGFPNTFFISDLIHHGIEIRTRDNFTLKQKYPNGKAHTSYQETHRNMTLIDGHTALTGSSTISPFSHEGHSREMNVQIYSNQQVKRYESQFLQEWNDDKKTLIVDIENFQAIIEGKSLSKPYSSLINNMATMIIRNKKNINKK
ncbi:MAG: phosphatidylserine/phosphatidylglycerophosphate/cardiolipin synthase family protein [Bacteriovoracaceae bacterium]|jgi:phosphatidylserine/phosphatidylglycerophosphate/cardiolipin synthase-like enzyme|nr:phosphatidylserine/phosphatidylglycerophosphate/cardiolipin synthase family protein [Bacteriovoracaceae bacterium]